MQRACREQLRMNEAIIERIRIMRAPGSDAEPPPTGRPKGWRGRPAGTGGHTGAPTGPQRRLYGPRSPRESGPPVGEEAIRRAADTLASGAAVRATVPRDRPTGGPPNPWRTRPGCGPFISAGSHENRVWWPLSEATRNGPLAAAERHTRGPSSPHGSLPEPPQIHTPHRPGSSSGRAWARPA